MKKSVIILLLCLLAFSCEKQYDLRLDSYDARLLVECFPGLNDTTVIFLKATTPVTQKDSIPPSLAQASVKLDVNGEERPVLYASSGMGTVPAGSFYSIGKIPAGSSIEVSASANGLESIKSETKMPSCFKDIVPEFAPDANSNSVILSVPVPEELKYFGLTVVLETAYCTASRSWWSERDGSGKVTKIEYDELQTDTYVELSYEVPHLLFESDLEWADVMEFGFDGRSILNPVSSSRIYFGLLGPSDLTSDRKFQGRIYCPKDHVSCEYADDGTLLSSISLTTRLKLIVYNLSPEMYRFARARYEEEYNNLAFLGLAPASFTYSNVRGGFGALGAFTMWESGWYSNPLKTLSSDVK